MANNKQIDQFIQNMMNPSQGSDIDGLADNDNAPQEGAAAKTPAPKFEPSFEQKHEVDKLRASRRDKKLAKDPAEETRRTVGIEMTEKEIFRIDKAVYELRMTKRELIRTAIQEYLKNHGL